MQGNINTVSTRIISAVKCIKSPITLVLVLLSGQAHGQQAYVPPPIPNMDVDSFGIELKSGRYRQRSVDVISVGSADSKISVNFDISDSSRSFHNYVGRISFPNNSNAAYVEYAGSSEAFQISARHTSSDQTVDYVPYIDSGSTLKRTLANGLYTYTLTVKDGTYYQHQSSSERSGSNSIVKISRANGNETYIGGGFIRNNRGYQVKYFYDINQNIVLWQALNNTKDRCADSSESLCVSAFSRIGKSKATFDAVSVENAALEKTIYKFTTMSVNTGTVYESVSLPDSIDLPGNELDEIKIKYNYPNIASNSLENIMVIGVTRGTSSSTYQYEKTAIPTNGTASPGYHLKTSAFVNNIKQFDAYSVTPPTSSASSPRARSTMLTYTDALGYVRTFQADKFGNIAGITYPSGLFVRHEIDSRNNFTKTITGKAGLINQEIVRVFPSDCVSVVRSACNLPISITDANKTGVTDYTYNSRGQIISVTLPSSGADSLRSKTTFEYELRTAYIKDEAGSVVAAGSPISLLTKASTCMTSESCLGSKDEVITTYYYGPQTGLNNLNLVGVGVSAEEATRGRVTRWTCFKYDYFGQKIAETSPRAGISICPMEG